jgi:OmcA/MtrC family decaheme c-type cytochrome
VGTPLIPFATATAFPVGTPFPPEVENYAAEVAYPAVGLNCNGCHVNDSWKSDLGPIGSVVAKPLLGAAMPLTVDTDPLNWRVISPRAATCTSCHDSAAAIDHVTSAGGSTFGTRTQGQFLLDAKETCNDCHAAGQRLGVDVVHGLR